MPGQEAPEQRAKCSCPQAGGTRLPTLFKERAQAALQKEEEGRSAPGSCPESLTARAGQAHPCPDLQRTQSRAQPLDGLAPVPRVPLWERHHQQCRHRPVVRGCWAPRSCGRHPSPPTPDSQAAPHLPPGTKHTGPPRPCPNLSVPDGGDPVPQWAGGRWPRLPCQSKEPGACRVLLDAAP